jgi:hypothetical protein
MNTVTGALSEPFPLFLLFSQEIISGPHRLRRTSPWFSTAQLSKEQRAGSL